MERTTLMLPDATPLCQEQVRRPPLLWMTDQTEGGSMVTLDRGHFGALRPGDGRPYRILPWRVIWVPEG